MKLLITLLLLPLTALAGDYKRSDWPHWADLDRDCQDTRQEILAEESAKPPKYRTKKECVVDSGNWLEPYAGKVVDSPKKLDIEHIIPLKYAHDHGGAGWPRALKKQFANDRLNVLAVDFAENRQRGAKGPSEWQPANEGFHCQWAAMQFVVLSKYRVHGLRYAGEDLMWLVDTLGGCSLEVLEGAKPPQQQY